VSKDGILEFNNETDEIFNLDENFQQYEEHTKLNQHVNFSNMSDLKLCFTNKDPFLMTNCIIIAFVYSLFRTK
jgi:hypothetical protein